MKLPPTLAPHPRLYLGPAEWDRLRRPPTLPFLKKAARDVARLAARYAADPKLSYDPRLHNALLLRAREAQGRVVTLLARWVQTGEGRFRAAALREAGALGRWKHWASDAERAGDRNFQNWYDLSYGENCATLAIAYDRLHATLDPRERRRLVSLARTRGLEPLRAVLRRHRGKPGWHAAWWFGHPHTNWNTVCMGGAGMLALAMREELGSLADEVLELAEESLRPYFEGMGPTRGGWVEGIGYWNYGHRYAFMYLLSREGATGRPHPLLALPGVRETLAFPLDFSPHGQCCSFPDVNVWSPLPFHYRAAARLACPEVARALDARVDRFGLAPSPWPGAAEILALHPGGAAAARRPAPARAPVAKLYPGMDWAILADRLPEPRLYMALRGGSTEVPHSMVDLLSFQVVVAGEKLVHNYSNEGGDDYLETTFSARRNDIFEMGPAAKNGLFINGVGLPDAAAVRTRAVRGPGFVGFRLDATTAFGTVTPGVPMADFCGRLFLMLRGRAFLIVDRFELPKPGRVEARLHTFARCRENPGKDGFLLRGKRESLRIVQASGVAAVTASGVACPTKPVRGARVLRWATVARTHTHVTLATLLAPGIQAAALRLKEDRRGLGIEASGPGWRSRVRMSLHLEV